MTAAEISSSFLIGAAIGSGSTALAAELGGADFLLAISAGRLRNMGAPSIACMLPIFDAHKLTEGFAREELLTQCRVPVLIGVDVWGPKADQIPRARAIRAAGFAGAVNFPSCMHYSRAMQQILARVGRGIESEIEQLRLVQEQGLTSMFYCATRTQARLAADAGIDLVCLNLGWNVGGAFGHRRRQTIEEVAALAREIGRLIKRINPRTRFLLEGGPIATSNDLSRIVELSPIDGYVGGSTIERIPLESSVADQISRFRQVGKRRRMLDNEESRILTWSRKFGFVGRSPSQISFLRRLRNLSTATGPVLILSEPGLDPLPVINALNRAGRKQGSGNVVHLDVGAMTTPSDARTRLFGGGSDAAEDALLGDSNIDLLAIHAPQNLSPAIQRRLARTLLDGSFRGVRERRARPLAPRVILVHEGSLSSDTDDIPGVEASLLNLFQGWRLRIPPLRERRDDLMTLIGETSSGLLNKRLTRSNFSAAALRTLHAHQWPGNDTEVRTLVGALAGRSWSEAIQVGEIPTLTSQAALPCDDGSEKQRIVNSLWRHNFNRSRAAAELGMSRKTLYNKMQKFGLSG